MFQSIVFVCLIILAGICSTPAHADYEVVKDWEDPLICWPVDANGVRGEAVKLLWQNFIAFDENSRMVFLKINKGLHTVPTKGWICLPESVMEDGE